MPVAFSQQGPFSVDTFILTSSTATDSPANRTFTLTNADFDPTLPETLEVTVNGVKLKGTGSQVGASVSGDEFYIDNATNPTTVTIETNTRLNAVTDSTITSLGSGDVLIIKRISNRTSKNVDYAPGSVIRETDLDNSNTQIMHVAQEAIDIALNSIQLDGDNKFNANDGVSNRVIKNVATPVSANDAVSKTYLEDTWLTSADKTNSATVAELDTEIALLGTSAMATASTGHLARLGTAAVVEDMGLLGTADCVADMALLGTSDCVADMALLATSDIIADMNTLATSDIVADMNTLATSDIIADLNTLATSDIVSDLDTVATNIASVNNFADKYRVASSAPGSDNDEGDLYYNTTANSINYYDGSAWQSFGVTLSTTQTEASNAAVAMSIALG